jgi:hypothetical protein
MFKDFATGDTGSCFDLVMQMYGLTLGKTLRLIDNDFNLGICNNTALSLDKLPKRAHNIIIQPRVKSNIEITSRKWNSREDKVFWSKYCIKASTLNMYNVVPIEHVWINSSIVNSHKKDNPIYGYKFFKDDKTTWKIYQPYSSKFKWVSNTDKSVLQGWDQLPDSGDLLIITKSLKDVICLYELGIPAIAPQSESQDLKGSVLNDLRGRFSTIIVFFDNDFDKSENIGRIHANKFCDINHLNKIEIPDDYKCKDISDYISESGIDKAFTLIYKLLDES